METITFPAQVFKVLERPELSFDSQAEAAQEAEFLHMETNQAHHVTCNGELCYTSEGAPDDED